MEQIETVFGPLSEQIQSIFGWKAGAVWITLFFFGWFYKWLVYDYLPDVKKVKNRTAELVVGGVLVTLLGHGFIVGWNTVVMGWETLVNVLICFACSGAPMVIGYWNKDAGNSSKDHENAKKVVDETGRSVVERIKRLEKA